MMHYPSTVWPDSFMPLREMSGFFSWWISWCIGETVGVLVGQSVGVFLDYLTDYKNHFSQGKVNRQLRLLEKKYTVSVLFFD